MSIDQEKIAYEVVIDTEFSRLDITKIHMFLSQESSWAQGIDRETVEKSLKNSLCFGAYQGGAQIGFCRVVTDYATFGNLVDVIVWPQWRGQGISRLLMAAVMREPMIKGLRRFMLATTNAHGLYEKFGFTQVTKPDSLMEIYNPDIYQQDCAIKA